MWIVIMDFVYGKTVNETSSTSITQVEALEKVAATRHMARFVHRDPGESNMLLPSAQPGLVRFGWCGRDILQVLT
jgi:tRNA A-37 threonylcarbamoyl transferase component Bud32